MSSLGEKLSEAFIGNLQRAWETHGESVIEKVRENDPTTYLSVIASLIPRDVSISHEPFDGMTDQQLTARTRVLNKQLKTQGLDFDEGDIRIVTKRIANLTRALDLIVRLKVGLECNRSHH